MIARPIACVAVLIAATTLTVFSEEGVAAPYCVPKVGPVWTNLCIKVVPESFVSDLRVPTANNILMTGIPVELTIEEGRLSIDAGGEPLRQVIVVAKVNDVPEIPSESGLGPVTVTYAPLDSSCVNPPSCTVWIGGDVNPTGQKIGELWSGSIYVYSGNNEFGRYPIALFIKVGAQCILCLGS